MAGPQTKPTPTEADLLFSGDDDEDMEFGDAGDSAAEAAEDFDFDVDEGLDDDDGDDSDSDAGESAVLDEPRANQDIGAGGSGPPPPGIAAPPVGGEGLPGDGIDLRPDQRHAIDIAWTGLDQKSHYEVLLLPRSADEKAIKKAYYRLSKEYHPDKFYRKQLGPYKIKLEAIFNRVTEAYRVLNDGESRAEYDALQGTPAAPRDATSQAFSHSTVDVTFVPDSMRQKMPTRKTNTPAGATPAGVGKRPPAVFIQNLQKDLAQRVLKAREYAKAGQEAYEKARYAEAATQFQLALAMDPRSTKLKALMTRAQGQARNGRAEGLWKQAMEAKASDNQKAAADLMQKAIDCKPTRGRYFNEFGKFVMTNTLQQKNAVEHLKHAVDLEPNNVAFLTDLGLAYDELGMPSNALRVFEKILTIEPKNSTATKLVKKLK